MTNFVVIAVLLVILGLAAGYVIKEKKKGRKCIGCPHDCSSKNTSCGCSSI